MALLDILLFPFYVFAFHLFFREMRRTYKDPLLRKYHKHAFWIKIFTCVAFTVFNVFISIGDSTVLYHREGLNIYHMIMKDSDNLQWLFCSGREFDQTLLFDPYNTGYFDSDANYLVVKLVAIFSFLTLGKYFLINLIFAMIAFTGVWKLFLFFYEQFPKHHKKFAIAVLYMPSFVFWSSGILKDTLCIAALGWITYTLYEILFKKKSIIGNAILLVIFGYILAIVKVYILISYVPVFILFIILKGMEGFSNSALKYTIAPLLIIVSVLGFSKVLKSFDEELGVYAVKGITKSVKNLSVAIEKQAGSGTAESNFSLGVEYDGSVSGLVKLAPIAIGTTLFRPFIWEVHNVSSIMAALESLVLIFFTLFVIFKAGLMNFIKLIVKEPIIMYCFVFSMVFALFVGASTLNFGTLVRYKMPCMPFYVICLFLIYEKVKETKSLKASKVFVEQAQHKLQLTPATA